MFNMPLSCLFVFISTLAIVSPFKIKSSEILLAKQGNNGYLLKINSTSSSELPTDQIYELTKQDQLSDHVFTLDESGNLKEKMLSSHTDDEVFTVTDLSTSVTISLDSKTNKYSIEGILDNEWMISPETIWTEPDTCAVCLPVMVHTITRVETETFGADYELLPENTTLSNYEDQNEAYAESNDGNKYPEVLVAVDYSLHKKLGRNEARTKQYVQKHFNSVNSIYASLSDPRVKMVLAGVVIGSSASSLPYLHNGGSYSRSFDARRALGSMGRYYNSRGVDLVIALTDRDMQVNGRSGVIGYAYVGGACNRGRKVGLVEDRGTYNGVTTMAHEIGHLLGSNHDGDRGATSCRGGYIMSPTSNGSRRWSTCSIRQLKSFLTSRRANCMNNKPSGVTGVVVSNGPETPYRPNIGDTINGVVSDVNNVIFDFFNFFFRGRK